MYLKYPIVLDCQVQEPVLLDKRSLTSSMIISNDLLEIYNGNWTFESANASHPIGKHLIPSNYDVRGWYYEASLLSSGIMQIGNFIFSFTL